MITIKTFVFNPFQVNMYLLYDETKECVIVDAACMSDDEERRIVKFISSNNLKPVHLISTHPHIDHVAGNKFIYENYKIPLPPLSTQQTIIAEIEAEQALVAANRELIERFEKKIQATIARVWGADNDDLESIP